MLLCRQCQSVFLTAPAIDDYRHGLAHLRSGDLAGAEVRLRASIDENPDWSPPHVTLGDLYRQMGRRHQSEKTYRRALRIDPLSLKALEGLGQLLQASGDTSAAIRLYTEALEVRPGWLPFYLQLRDLYLSGKKRQEAERITHQFKTLINADGRAKGYWSIDYNFRAEIYKIKAI